MWACSSVSDELAAFVNHRGVRGGLAFSFLLSLNLLAKETRLPTNWAHPQGPQLNVPLLECGTWLATHLRLRKLARYGVFHCVCRCHPPYQSRRLLVYKTCRPSIKSSPSRWPKHVLQILDSIANMCKSNMCKSRGLKYSIQSVRPIYTGTFVGTIPGWHICANNLKHWHIFNEACPPHTAGNRVHHDLHLLEYSTFHSIFGSCLHC